MIIMASYISGKKNEIVNDIGLIGDSVRNK